ncbi:hypothetical protein HK096_005841, partial [Nowakowskiella sp. JEL0078]
MRYWPNVLDKATGAVSSCELSSISTAYYLTFANCRLEHNSVPWLAKHTKPKNRTKDHIIEHANKTDAEFVINIPTKENEIIAILSNHEFSECSPQSLQRIFIWYRSEVKIILRDAAHATEVIDTAKRLLEFNKQSMLYATLLSNCAISIANCDTALERFAVVCHPNVYVYIKFEEVEYAVNIKAIEEYFVSRKLQNIESRNSTMEFEYFMDFWMQLFQARKIGCASGKEIMPQRQRIIALITATKSSLGPSLLSMDVKCLGWALTIYGNYPLLIINVPQAIIGIRSTWGQSLEAVPELLGTYKPKIGENIGWGWIGLADLRSSIIGNLYVVLNDKAETTVADIGVSQDGKSNDTIDVTTGWFIVDRDDQTRIRKNEHWKVTSPTEIGNSALKMVARNFAADIFKILCDKSSKPEILNREREIIANEKLEVEFEGINCTFVADPNKQVILAGKPGYHSAIAENRKKSNVGAVVLKKSFGFNQIGEFWVKEELTTRLINLVSEITAIYESSGLKNVELLDETEDDGYGEYEDSEEQDEKENDKLAKAYLRATKVAQYLALKIVQRDNTLSYIEVYCIIHGYATLLAEMIGTGNYVALWDELGVDKQKTYKDLQGEQVIEKGGLLHVVLGVKLNDTEPLMFGVTNHIGSITYGVVARVQKETHGHL